MLKEDWKSVKITKSQSEEIKRLRNEGHLTLTFLAKKFKCDISTIYYHSDPLYRRYKIITGGIRSRRIKLTDPVKYKKIVDNSNKRIKERSRSDPQYRTWLNNYKLNNKKDRMYTNFRIFMRSIE